MLKIGIGGISLLCILCFAKSSFAAERLVAKNIPVVTSTQSHIYAFGSSSYAPLGREYSRLDFSDISRLGFKNDSISGIDLSGVIGLDSALFTWYNHTISDSAFSVGVTLKNENGTEKKDSIRFRTKLNEGAYLEGFSLNAAAQAWGWTVLALGRGGIAAVRNLGTDSLHFYPLFNGADTAIRSLSCISGPNGCRVDSSFAKKTKSAEIVTYLLLDSAQTDTLWLWIGTNKGLRRTLLPVTGSFNSPIQLITKVNLPGDKDSLPILSLFREREKGRILAFQNFRFTLSQNHGQSWRESGIGFAVEGRPDAAFWGDSLFVNFNSNPAGLALFLSGPSSDSLIPNLGSGKSSTLIDAPDGLNLIQGEKITRIASLSLIKNEKQVRYLAVGTSGSGIYFYRSQTGKWINESRFEELRGGLMQVITFPTVFGGTEDPTHKGKDLDVRIGYKLNSNADVSISVYNYAMEKVRTIVTKSPRIANNRSENPEQDRWDGKDQSGRLCSAGVYYILVQASTGEKGWGKAIHARGRQ